MQSNGGADNALQSNADAQLMMMPFLMLMITKFQILMFNW
jgi:hypothetical protein